jgi:hypothetical protein
VVRPSSKFKLKIDFGAERQILEMENNKEKMVVEVKSFLDTSFMNDFHDTHGQYSDYTSALEYAGIKRQLFLAVPDDVYEKHFLDLIVYT